MSEIEDGGSEMDQAASEQYRQGMQAGLEMGPGVVLRCLAELLVERDPAFAQAVLDRVRETAKGLSGTQDAAAVYVQGARDGLAEYANGIFARRPGINH